MKNDFYLKLSNLVSSRASGIIICILLASIFPLFILPQLKFKSDYAELVSQDTPHHREFDKYVNNFGTLKALHVIIESKNARAIVDNSASKILQLKDANGEDLVQRVLYKVDKSFILRHGLLFAEETDLQQLEDKSPFLLDLAKTQNIAEFFQAISQFMEQQSQQDSDTNSSQQDNLSDLFVSFRKSLEAKEVQDLPQQQSQVKTSLPGIDSEGYFVLPDGKVLMQVFPTTTSDDFRKLEVFFSAVKAVLDEQKQQYPAEILYTGSPKLIIDEMHDMFGDIGMLTVFPIVGVTLLFIISFRKLLWPTLSVFVLAIAVLWTFGFAIVTFGYLNVVSIVFAAVLVGLGIDFGIHLIKRYHEILSTQTPDHTIAIREAITKSGKAITTGAITTAGAFFLSSFSGFKGTFQLGVLGGVGILICLALMLTLLPALLVKLTKDATKSENPQLFYIHQPSIAMGIMEKILVYPKSIIFVHVVLVALSCFAIFETEFDYDLLNLQRKNSKAVSLEKEMSQSGFSSRFAVVLKETTDIKEVRKAVDVYKNLEVVKKVQSITDLIPENQDATFLRVQNLRKLFKDVDNFSPISQAPDKDVLVESLEALQEQCENFINDSTSGFGGGNAHWVAILGKIVDEIDKLLQILENTEYQTIQDAIQNYQTQVISNIRDTVAKISSYLDVQKCNMENIPSSILEHFVGKNNLYAVYIYPKNNIGEPQHLKDFVTTLQKIDPKVTGPSVGYYVTLTTMKEGYQRAGVIALIGVFVLLLFEFRSFSIAGLTILPLLCGAAIMMGIMYLIDLRINPANLMALPLIFGIGIDHGIHIMHRYYCEQEHDIDKIVHTTGHAIWITSLTTVIGFGSVSLATYRGLSSLGNMMVIGVLTCMFTSIILLPALLKTIVKYKKG